MPQRNRVEGREVPPSITIFFATFTIFVVLATVCLEATVVGSRHDLSTTTGASVQVCAFCHTPHGANDDLPILAPLWNRFVDTNQVFTVYSSPTMDTFPGNPNFSISMLCLGCHDGTIGTAVVNGITGSTKHDLVNAPGPGGTPDTTSYPNCRNCHGEMYGDPPAYWLGTDLSNDHPVAVFYPTTAQDPMFNVPPDLTNGWPDVPLYSGQIECSTCHNPHDQTFIPFLRVPSAGSYLCVTCHIK